MGEKISNYARQLQLSKYIKIKEAGSQLDASTATAVAKAMKKWAIKNDVTHYTHWFAPLTGKTAEKQVSFIDVDKNGELIEEFSAKSLIKGEADASSFPNGGERMTFEIPYDEDVSKVLKYLRAEFAKKKSL